MLDRATRNGITGAARAPLADRKDDLYETPPEAVRALLRVEQLPHFIWEPACGPGSIVTVLREAGHTVFASDLVEYGCPDSVSRRDFLMEWASMWTLPYRCEAIVTNPPFKLAREFVERALQLTPKVVMLLRLAFLEGSTRAEILDRGHLARVHVFRNRLPRMHRAGWTGKQASSSLAFAWYVWDVDHKGPTELKRLSWK